MTAVQKARLQSFNASLKQRGVLLRLRGLDAEFNALVQPVSSESEEFSVGNETRNASKVHVLRGEAGIVEARIGSVFVDDAASFTHRVIAIEDHPANVAVVFHCETAAAE